MKADQQRMRDVLVDTIRLLCRTGVEYSRRLRVQGLLGITVDDDHVFLIHVDDCIARNCTEMEDSLSDYADDCNTTTSHSLVDANATAGKSGSENSTVSIGVSRTSSQPVSVDAAINHSSDSPQNQSNRDNISTSIAVSETSSDISGVSAGQEIASSSVQNTVPFVEGISQAEAALPCLESTSSSRGGVTESLVAETSADMTVPRGTFVPVEIPSVNDSEPPGVVKMETDAACAGNFHKTAASATSQDNTMHEPAATRENTHIPTAASIRAMPPLMSITNQNIHLLAAAASQSPHQSLNFDDLDSSIGDSNDDGDSDRTSGSEDVVDCMSVPQINLRTSLHVDTRSLVANMSNWPLPVTNKALNTSESGTTDGGVKLQAGTALLAGVVPTATPQAPSAYYQQQMLAAAAAAAHNRAARAAAVSVKSMVPMTTESGSIGPPPHYTSKDTPPTMYSASHRRLPRRPRESEDKRFRCPFCELAYYHKKHLKYHLTKKHGF